MVENLSRWKRSTKKMTEFYREQTLPSAICQIVRDKLAKGNSLARIVLSCLDHHPFRVRSLLPDTISAERALKVDQGGLFESDIAQTQITEGARITPINTAPSRSWIVEEILKFHGRNLDSLVLFEDALAARGDPYLTKRSSEIWYCGDEVFVMVRADGADKNQIETAIRETYSIPLFIGVMSRSAWVPNLDSSLRDLSQQNLRDIAAGSEAIIVGAYDGEGLLLCDQLPKLK